MKSIFQMELEDKFNRKIKYREKKLKNQRMIIGKQQEEIERLNTNWNELEKYINEEYIYDELGMKMFDASTLQDKLQELRGEDKE